MRLVADECVPADVVTLLRDAGHEVHAIRDIARGATDEEVLRLAVELGSPLVTEDLDFGEMVFRRGQISAGVILLRMAGAPNADKAAALLRRLEEHPDGVQAAFFVVTTSSVRIRRSPTG
ncbi:MAG: DUF5615 family PIN-like protein [Dehalococcoidia bacterium]|nr:DUF5615 family PIN-like protein [Dehalococcoidia bacterium]